MQVDFDAHGECDISIVDDIIEIKTQGPWNIEFSNELHRQLAHAASHFSKDNTLVLLCLIGDALAGKKEIEAHVKFISIRQAAAVAVDFSQCSTTEISQVIFARIYKLTNQKYRFFNERDEARAWIKQQRKIAK